jgi:DNA or RNA helicases of superfamily II
MGILVRHSALLERRDRWPEVTREMLPFDAEAYEQAIQSPKVKEIENSLFQRERDALQWCFAQLARGLQSFQVDEDWSLRTGFPGGGICLPTGSGKTRLGAVLAAELLARQRWMQDIPWFSVLLESACRRFPAWITALLETKLFITPWYEVPPGDSALGRAPILIIVPPTTTLREAWLNELQRLELQCDMIQARTMPKTLKQGQ